MLQTACWIVHVGDVMRVLLAEDAATARDGPPVGQVNARQILRRDDFQQRAQRRPQVHSAREVFPVHARL